jgi:hypothetical protein
MQNVAIFGSSISANRQGLLPSGPNARQHDPEHAVRVGQSRPTLAMLQNGQLLPQSQILNCQRLMGTQRRPQRLIDDSQPFEHSSKATSAIRKKTTKSVRVNIQEGQWWWIVDSANIARYALSQATKVPENLHCLTWFR